MDIKELKKIFTAYFVSSLGNFSARLMLATVVFALTGSKISLAASFMITRLPTLLFGASIGEFSESFASKKKAMIVSDCAGGILFTVLAFFYDKIGAMWCAALFFLSYCASSLFDSSKSSLVHDACPDKKSLSRAAATLQQLTYTALAVGPFIAGYLNQYFGARDVFLFNVATYLVSIVIILGVRDVMRNPKMATPNTSRKFTILESLMLLKGNTYLKTFSLFLFLRSIVYGVVNALIPVYVFTRLNAGSSGLGNFFLISCIGAVMGTYLYKRYFSDWFLTSDVPRQNIIALSLVEGIFLLLCIISNNLIVFLIFGFLYCIPMLITESYVDYVFIRHAPDGSKSRIGGCQQMLKSWGYGAGVLISLPVASHVGSDVIPILLGLALFFASVVTFFKRNIVCLTEAKS